MIGAGDVGWDCSPSPPSSLLHSTAVVNPNRCVWAGGIFFSCAVVSVFGSGGKYVLVLHTTTYVLRVQHSCGVVLVFWFWREIVAGVTYVLSVQYSCAVV